jgi:NADH-quinone oxidoreductase subunit N
LAILLVVSTVGWTHGASGGSLPEALRVLLWVIAALTMTVGNVLALLQSSAKRILAYSSIAHSGYMLVGVIAGPGSTFARSGVAAVLFYLLVYGVMTTGAFAVLASLERRAADGTRTEVNNVNDLRGLWRTHPWLAACLGVCSLSLLGLPPILGFFGKLPLFTSAISAGEYALVVVLAINSAIAAFYYLRLVYLPWLASPADDAGEIVASPFGWRRVVATLCTLGVVVTTVFAGPLMAGSERAAAAGRTHTGGAERAASDGVQRSVAAEGVP